MNSGDAADDSSGWSFDWLSLGMWPVSSERANP
jgi:hypothetical protein